LGTEIKGATGEVGLVAPSEPIARAAVSVLAPGPEAVDGTSDDRAPPLHPDTFTAIAAMVT
jgi:hypothetical protein